MNRTGLARNLDLALDLNAIVALVLLARSRGSQGMLGTITEAHGIISCLKKQPWENEGGNELVNSDTLPISSIFMENFHGKANLVPVLGQLNLV